jgi:hypothetical protein
MKFFLYDETMMNTKAKITTAKLSAMGDIVAQKAQYITAAGSASPDQVTIAAGVIIAVGPSIFETTLTNLTAANLDTGSGFEKGSDYYIYCCDPSNGSETLDQDEIFVISKNSTYPSGYTAENSRKVGGFHYGIVRRVNASGNPISSSGTENGSGWEGNVYTGIVPNSVWTTKHRPKCDDPSGMVYLGNGLWGDIYLSSDNGSNGLQSKYNATPITGTEGLNWYIANEKARRVGKRLPTYAEFCQAAAGSPEGQDGNNTYAWSATGNTGRQKTGYVQNAISALNIRDLVGNVWKWLDEFCLDPTATTWAWQDVLGTGYGDAYMPSATALHALIGGGRWGGGVRDGSRAVACDGYPWNVYTYIGVWCVCDAL